MGRRESRKKERLNTPEKSIKSARKSKAEAILAPQMVSRPITHEQMMNKIWQKCLNLGKFQENPLEAIELMMEEEWNEKIISKFEGMGRLPRGRIFNQASQEFWFEIYSDKQAFGFLPTRRSIKTDKELREELSVVSREIEALEAQTKKSYSF